MEARNIRVEMRRGGLLFLFSLAYLYLFVRVLWRVGDEGILVYGAQLVAEGALPYRDFLDIMGPGSWYWLGLFFKLFGTKFTVARGLLLLTGAVTTFLIYWMTRRLYKGPFEMLPALFHLMISIPIWPSTSHHWDSNLFALIAVSLFFLWQDKGSSRYLIITGVVAGLTSCFMQQKGLFLVLGFLVVILINAYRLDRQRAQILSHVGKLLIGYAGVGALVILFFYLSGGLTDLIYATFTFPANAYYNANVTPYGYALFKFHWPSWQTSLRYFLPPPVDKVFAVGLLIPFIVIMALPILMIILTSGSCLFGRNRVKFFDELLLPYWICGLALWLSELQRKDIFHLIFGSPLLLILLFVIWNKMSKNKRLLRTAGLAVVTAGLICFGTYNALGAAAANNKLTTRRGTVYTFREDGALKFLNEQIQAKDQVFIYPCYPMYYFLADIKNPTRFNVMLHWPNTEQMFNEAVAALDRKKVKYVLWDTFADGVILKNWFPAYRQPREEKLVLERYMTSHYEMIGLESGWRILRRLDGS